MDAIIALVFLLSVTGFIIASLVLYAKRNKTYTEIKFEKSKQYSVFIDRFVDDFSLEEINQDVKIKKDKDKDVELV